MPVCDLSLETGLGGVWHAAIYQIIRTCSPFFLGLSSWGSGGWKDEEDEPVWWITITVPKLPTASSATMEFIASRARPPALRTIAASVVPKSRQNTLIACGFPGSEIWYVPPKSRPKNWAGVIRGSEHEMITVPFRPTALAFAMPSIRRPGDFHVLENSLRSSASLILQVLEWLRRLTDF